MTGLGDLHHPVSTRNAEAQKFFDQGLRLIYAFNHEEAAGSFQRAAELDPKLAMAYWGIAEAVGPNYNDPADPDRYKQAHEAIAKAGELAASCFAQLRKPISRPWRCAFPPIPTRTSARRRSAIATPWATWSNNFLTILTQRRCSLKPA